MCSGGFQYHWENLNAGQVTILESRCRECKFWIIDGSVARLSSLPFLPLFSCAQIGLQTDHHEIGLCNIWWIVMKSDPYRFQKPKSQKWLDLMFFCSGGLKFGLNMKPIQMYCSVNAWIIHSRWVKYDPEWPRMTDFSPGWHTRGQGGTRGSREAQGGARGR